MWKTYFGLRLYFFYTMYAIIHQTLTVQSVIKDDETNKQEKEGLKMFRSDSRSTCFSDWTCLSQFSAATK